jgi:hypothetical protein
VKSLKAEITLAELQYQLPKNFNLIVERTLPSGTKDFRANSDEINHILILSFQIFFCIV